MNFILIAITILLINIPFGYWRAGVKKFSIHWFLAIHIPVPFVILLRYIGGIGYELYTYIVFISVFIAGQKIGELIFRNRNLSLEKEQRA